jgi:hypothetical protein
MRTYTDTISEALERMDDLGYERGSGNDLANHGPMGAEALAALGFTGEVPSWVERYRRAMPHHEPPSGTGRIDPDDEGSWRSALGQFGRAGDWEGLFRAELRESAWPEVVERWWPRLLPGLMSRLTHGLIRTAHAVRSVAAEPQPSTWQLGELARGLAYWAARYTALPGTPRVGGTRSVEQAVARVPRQLPGSAQTPRLAAPRLRALGGLAGYRESLADIAPATAEQLLSEMTAAFAGIYAAHPEAGPVPLVHGVTAPAAIRLVLPYLPGWLHQPSIAAMWQTHLALLLAFTGSAHGEQQARERAAAAGAPSAAELAGRALDHGDEHVIKLTEACLRENALRPDPRYAAAALAACERIPRPGR